MSDKISGLISLVASKTTGRMMRASELPSVRQPRIPTGLYEVDYFLDGGFARAAAYHIYGESKSGKSSWMVHTMAFNMMIDPNWVAAVVDLENNWGPEYIEFMVAMGVDMDRVILITEEKCETALDKALKLLESRKLDFLVYDSVAMVISSTEQNKASEKASKTADRASMLELHARRVNTLLHPVFVPKTKDVPEHFVPNPCTVIYLNQLRTAGIGSYVAFRAPASGQALKFAVKNEIFLSSSQSDTSGDKIKYAYNADLAEKIPVNDQTVFYKNNGQIGKKVHFEIEKSRGGFENIQTQCDFYFRDLAYPSPTGFMGIGFDQTSSLLSIASYLGIIESSGSWYKILGQSIQGEAAALIKLRTNQEFREQLLNEVELKVYGRRLFPAAKAVETSESEEPVAESGGDDSEKPGNAPNKSVGGRKRKS